MKCTQFALLAGLVLLVSAALVVLFLPGLVQDAGAEQKPSNIAIHLDDDSVISFKIPGGRENSTDIRMHAYNHNESDEKDRGFLVFAYLMRTSGEMNWNLSLPDAVGGGPYFYRKTETSSFPMYKFVVKGDGTPTNATLRVTHYKNDLPANATDAIQINVFGTDYELDTEPEDPEERDRFFHKLVNTTTRNVSYLSKTGKQPATNYADRVTCLVSIFQPTPPWAFTGDKDEIALESGKEHTLKLSFRNYWYMSLSELTLKAGFKGFAGLDGALSLESPYQLDDPISMASEFLDLDLFLNLSKAVENVPGGDYELDLRASFGGYHNESFTVLVSVPNIHGLYVNLTGEDELEITGEAQTLIFHYLLSNHGNVVENVTLRVEVGTVLTRAGETDAHWAREFKPGSQFKLDPGQEQNVSLEIVPAFDNTKIPAGSYPIVVTASSDSDETKTDHALSYVTMPWLYSRTISYQPPTKSSILRPGQETEFRFWITNTGLVADSFLVNATVAFEGTGQVASYQNPGSWGVDIIDLYTGSPVENSTLPPIAPGGNRELKLIVQPPDGAEVGVYTMTMILGSPASGGESSSASTQSRLESSDLFIDWEDITIRKDDGSEIEWTTALSEGTPVTIRVRVHLNGSMNLPVEVGFYYRPDEKYELISTQIADFTGESGTDVVRVVEIGWKAQANGNPLIFDNLKVIVDPGNKIGESNEGNNHAVTGIMVEKKDDGGSPGFEPALLVSVLLLAALVREGRKRKRN